jgi:hypothetical protein
MGFADFFGVGFGFYPVWITGSAAADERGDSNSYQSYKYKSFHFISPFLRVEYCALSVAIFLFF